MYGSVAVLIQTSERVDQKSEGSAMSTQRQDAAQGTPVSAKLRSPVGRTSNPKAPARITGKKRVAAASNGTTKQRATRRELKKLTEMDLEEKDDVPQDVKAAESEGVKPFGADTADVSVTPSSLHDDFVNIMKANGTEKMATEVGIMKDGTCVDLQQPATPSLTATPPAKIGNRKKPLSAAAALTSPTFTSPYKRKYLKINKGLRHFSMKVCQKVEEKHVTSYNEVADEL
ncbi:hypothetical protein BBJ28_00023498, partial [Nothophytophthora sp. Chile5]